jgi:hypothetical protein
MAVLGQFGTVTLSREWPAPTVLAGQRLQHGESPSIDLSDLAFQSGDEVLLVALRGVPAAVGRLYAAQQAAAPRAYAPCPDGHAFWIDGETEPGPALLRRSANGGFWSADASKPFWESAATVGYQQTIRAYIHRDDFDDVRLYESEIDAINGSEDGLIPFRNVSPGVMLILPASTRDGYEASAISLLQSIVDSGVEISGGQQPAEDIATLPAVLTDTAEDIAERGWLLQCGLYGWVFEMDAEQLDQNAIGQIFGESAKGMLSGAGSFNGEISHEVIQGEQSGIGMLKLMMLTGQGSKARARFQLVDQRTAVAPLVNERVFYETDILLGKTSVDTQAQDVIKISAQFVATGKIKLSREGP